MNDPASNTPASGSPRLPAPLPSDDAPHWMHRLGNNRMVKVRAITSNDADLERRFIEHLSPESRRFRFLGQMSSPSDDLIHRLTDVDFVHDVAFVALVHEDNEKREVGVARYGVAPDGQSCECAVTVAEEWRHIGLGTALLRHLIDVARARGIQQMYSIDAADNHAMEDLARSMGFVRSTDPDDPTMVVHRLAL